MKVLRTENGYELDSVKVTGLAPRQSQTVLWVTTTSKTYAEIAHEMNCSISTVKSQLQNLFCTWNVHSKSELLTALCKAKKIHFLVLLVALHASAVTSHSTTLRIAKIRTPRTQREQRFC